MSRATDRTARWLYPTIIVSVLAAYAVAYGSLVKQVRAGITFGSLAWPKYSNVRQLNHWARVFFTPVHEIDRRVRYDFWRYKTWDTP